MPLSPPQPPPHVKISKPKRLKLTISIPFSRMTSVKNQSYSPINQTEIYLNQEEEISKPRKLQKARPLETPKTKVIASDGDGKSFLMRVRERLGIAKKAGDGNSEGERNGKDDEEKVKAKKAENGGEVKASGLARFDGTLWCV